MSRQILCQTYFVYPDFNPIYVFTYLAYPEKNQCLKLNHGTLKLSVVTLNDTLIYQRYSASTNAAHTILQGYS